MVAAPVGKQARRLNGMITVSRTGAFLWELLVRLQTQGDLVVRLMQACGGFEEEIAAGVGDFLDRAMARGLVLRLDDSTG